MAKLLVLYYSISGDIKILANADAAGAGELEEVEVTVKRVPKTMSKQAFEGAGGKANQAAKAATIDELA